MQHRTPPPRQHIAKGINKCGVCKKHGHNKKNCGVRIALEQALVALQYGTGSVVA